MSSYIKMCLIAVRLLTGALGIMTHHYHQHSQHTSSVWNTGVLWENAEAMITRFTLKRSRVPPLFGWEVLRWNSQRSRHAAGSKYNIFRFFNLKHVEKGARYIAPAFPAFHFIPAITSQLITNRNSSVWPLPKHCQMFNTIQCQGRGFDPQIWIKKLGAFPSLPSKK